MNSGFTPLGPALVDPITDNYLFPLYIIWAYLFQLGTPFLCGGAFSFWFFSRGSSLGKLGITFASLSLLIYIFTIRACFQLIS